VLATYNRRPPPRPLHVPENARLVEWLSYSRTMPHADLVICHGGHGTLVRALACGAPVVVVPAAGDMAENGARLQWCGAGISLAGRLLSARTLRWTVERVLCDDGFARRALELGRWAASHDGAARATALVEQLAGASEGGALGTHAAPTGDRSPM
jgi:UDP:flavonoid glycosyltransferase YjiC (YdhE family)